ncbi:MAG: hypothetical protein ACK518_02765 [bacterium]|jgi:hypothetical protein
MINSVRNTVLSVLNKNNYGYISPADFNLYAKQAQMEIFEEYFSLYNKSINQENSRISGTDYADMRKTISEVIEGFLMKNNLSNGVSGLLRNNFSIPSLTTTGDEAFMINTVIVYPEIIIRNTNTNVAVSQLIDFAVEFDTAGVKVGDIVVNLSNTITPFNNRSATVLQLINSSTLLLSADLFPSTPQNYAILSPESGVEADKVNEAKIFMLNRSNLTTPSNIFPSYVLNNQVFGLDQSVVTIYPSSIDTYGQVVCTYFRYPKDPKWTYITLFNGEPSFDQSQPDYQDFELTIEDEYKLVMKILQYCGISIREIEVAQFAMGQEQQQQQ